MLEKPDFSDVLSIWVQPLDTSSSDDEVPEVTPDRTKPIIQLDVTTDNYVDNTYVNGREAIQADGLCETPVLITFA